MSYIYTIKYIKTHKLPFIDDVEIKEFSVTSKRADGWKEVKSTYATYKVKTDIADDFLNIGPTILDGTYYRLGPVDWRGEGFSSLKGEDGVSGGLEVLYTGWLEQLIKDMKNGPKN